MDLEAVVRIAAGWEVAARVSVRVEERTAAVDLVEVETGEVVMVEAG